MALPIRVRDAGPWDNDPKQRVLDDAWISGHGHLFPEAAKHIQRGERPVETHSYDVPSAGTPIVADIKGQVVGVMDLRPLPSGYLLVEPIATDPTLHRRGIGRALWGRAIEIAKARGHKGLQVWAVDGNDKAHAFYTGMGCMPVGEGAVSFDGVSAAAICYQMNI